MFDSVLFTVPILYEISDYLSIVYFVLGATHSPINLTKS
jgi:hypothetical protein